MGLGILVRGRSSGALASSSSFHARFDGGEGGSEVVEGLGKRGNRVTNGEGDDLHPSPMSTATRVEYFKSFSRS